MMEWRIVYERAIRDDGSLFFPEKLSKEFLDNAKRTMGSYLYANQYLNEIIPSDKQSFKREWFKYYEELPRKLNTFVFVDPALSEADGNDYTGVVVVQVDAQNRWYIKDAKRYRLNPTQIVGLIFKLQSEFQPQIIGIEEVAYQKSLLYFLDEEMRRRNVVLPVKGIRPPNDRNKQTRILSLVPRFEWNRIFLNQGLQDLELELLQFPRGLHDDLIDALASIEYIYYPPDDRPEEQKKPHSPNDPRFESWYIQNIHKQSSRSDEDVQDY